MNTFSTRMSAFLLTASLVCAPAFGMEEVVTHIIMVEEQTPATNRVEEQELVMFEDFEDEANASENQNNEATVWYKKRSTQIAGAVATAYLVAICTGKVRSPLALVTALTALFHAKANNQENLENKKTNELNDLSIGGQAAALFNNGKTMLSTQVDKTKSAWNSINWMQSVDTAMDVLKPYRKNELVS